MIIGLFLATCDHDVDMTQPEEAVEPEETAAQDTVTENGKTVPTVNGEEIYRADVLYHWSPVVPKLFNILIQLHIMASPAKYIKRQLALNI